MSNAAAVSHLTSWTSCRLLGVQWRRDLEQWAEPALLVQVGGTTFRGGGCLDTLQLYVLCPDFLEVLGGSGGGVFDGRSFVLMNSGALTDVTFIVPSSLSQSQSELLFLCKALRRSAACWFGSLLTDSAGSLSLVSVCR